jgi:hypothetical protein
VDRPPANDYATATTAYQQVKKDADGLREQLAGNEGQRKQLDTLAQQAPDALAQARAQLDAAAQRLGALDSAIADQDAVLAPIRDQLTQAEAALGAHDARQAIERAQAAAQAVAALGESVQSYANLQARLEQRRVEALVLEQQGYRMDGSRAALEQSQTALAAAAAALERGGPAAAALPLADVLPALEQALANGRGLLALRAGNDERLLALGVRAREVAALIECGRRAFDVVDEFAESTWSDIRGNGSEAEASAAEAARLWARHCRKHDRAAGV